jgi:hypothetical protein
VERREEKKKKKKRREEKKIRKGISLTVVEGVMPDLLHIIPIGDDTML